MVHLIGVDHLVQYDGPVPEPLRDEFRSYLVAECRERGIVAIAEEFSDYALREVYQARIDTAREAARFLGIEHRYCDPCGRELSELGIPGFGVLLEEAKIRYGAPPSYILDDALRKKVTAHAVERARSYWHIREHYWFERLGDLLEFNVIFICGHEHVERFSSLLAARGYESVIITRFWRKELFVDYDALGLS